MFKYEATAKGTDEFGLRAMLQSCADGYWTPNHVDEEEAATMVLEAFKRKMSAQLELLDLKARRIQTSEK